MKLSVGTLCISNDEESVPPGLVACARGTPRTRVKGHLGLSLASGAVMAWKSGYQVSGTVAPVIALGLPSRLIIMTIFPCSSGCFFSQACDPTRPCSSAAKAMKTIERFGFAPVAAMRRIASIPGANPDPSPASFSASSPSRATGYGSSRPRPRCASSERRPGRRCPASPVADDVWSDVHEVPHVRLGQRADLVVVAPATADLLAKAAHGLADDLLTNTLLTARCPVVMAPAMHTEMWEHPATVANVATLRARGVLVIEPASGRLTGADTGKGRLPDPAEIFAVARRVLAARRRPRPT